MTKSIRNRFGLLFTLVWVATTLLSILAPIAQASHRTTSVQGITPTFHAGNPTCASLGTGWTQFVIEPPTSGSHSDGTITVQITVSGSDLTWSLTSGQNLVGAIDAVFVKGGDGGNLFTYSPEDEGDGGLFTPTFEQLNPNQAGNLNHPGISHISFCYDLLVKATASAQKLTVPSTQSAAGWTFNLSGPNVNENKTTGSNGVATFDSKLDEGTYTISEPNPTSGWSVSSSAGCTFTVDYPRDDGAVFSSCQITNTKAANAKAVKTTAPTSVSKEGWSMTLAGPGAGDNGETVQTNASGVAQFTTVLQPGTYQIRETATLTGSWHTTYSAGCDFTVAYPGHADNTFTCEVTNSKPASARAVKTTSPTSNSKAGWSMTLTGAGAGSNGETVVTDSDGIAAFTTVLRHGEQYTITEQAPTTGSWRTVYTGQCTFTPSYPTDADRLYTCNVANHENAGARAVKVTSPDTHSADGWEMSLYEVGESENTFVESGETENGQVTFDAALLDETTYVIVETDSRATNGNWRVDYDEGCGFTVTYPTDDGETFTCTITNSENAKARAVKVTSPDTHSADGWEMSLYEVGETENTFIESGETENGEVAFDAALEDGKTYLIVETAELQGDWDTGYDDGCEFDVDYPEDDGETFTCTVTNSEPAEAEATKVTSPTTIPKAGWSMTLYEEGSLSLLSPVETVVTDEDGDAPFTTQLEDGKTYVIAESDKLAGDYATTYDGECRFTVEYPADGGELFTCTVTNSEKAKATVVKVTSPSTESREGWTMILTGPGTPQDGESQETNENGVANFTTELEEGEYTITESSAGEEWRTGYSESCTFTVDYPADNGRVFSCTVTNSKSASARVVKVTNPTSLSTAGWSMTLSGPDGFTETQSTGTEGIAEFDAILGEGEYTVTETGIPGDVTATYSSCTFTVDYPEDDGQVFTCTVTNTKDAPPPPPELADVTITKIDSADPVTAGDNFSYTLQVTNNGPATAQSVGVSDPLPAGTGFVSVTTTLGTCEGGQTVTCSLGTMAAGASATIVITVSTGADTPNDLLNTATTTTTTPESNTNNNQDTEPTTIVRPPVVSRIVVEKQTLPDGSDETFGFTGDVTATLGDGETAIVDVEPGSYTVTESTIEGWDLTAIECDDDDSTGDIASATASFEVAEGETVKCTFTNLEEEVLGEIIDKDPKPSDPDPEVLPKVIEPEVLPGVLPFTGGDPVALIALAALMMLTGAAVVFSAKRPREVIEE